MNKQIKDAARRNDVVSGIIEAAADSALNQNEYT